MSVLCSLKSPLGKVLNQNLLKAKCRAVSVRYTSLSALGAPRLIAMWSCRHCNVASFLRRGRNSDRQFPASPARSVGAKYFAPLRGSWVVGLPVPAAAESEAQATLLAGLERR